MVQHVDPRLLSLIDRSEEIPWLFMETLQVGDILEVQTKDTLYTMKVLDPNAGVVLANSNGKHITSETRVQVVGSSITGTGTMIKVGGIAIGLRIVLFVPGKGQLIVSSAKEVCVNGTKVLPMQT